MVGTHSRKRTRLLCVCNQKQKEMKNRPWLTSSASFLLSWGPQPMGWSPPHSNCILLYLLNLSTGIPDDVLLRDLKFNQVDREE